MMSLLVPLLIPLFAVGTVTIGTSIDVAVTAFGAAGNSEDFAWFMVKSNFKAFKLLVFFIFRDN